jgi:hypothetical protein
MTLHKLTSRLLLLGEHCYLDSSDECYFLDLYECHCRCGNKPLIIKLKRRDDYAVADAVEQLASSLPPEWINHTFVPMPPCYGRLSPVRDIVRRLPVTDVRDLLVQKWGTPSSHDGWRPNPAERSVLMQLDETQANPKPSAMIIVDDVLTTGSHFRAAKSVARRRWPQLRVIGLFLARVCSRRNQGCFLAGTKPGNGAECVLWE